MNLNDITITDIINVINVFSPKGRLENMTDRHCYGLSFTAGGSITYIHNGKSFVSDRDHAIILPKGKSYTICGTSDGEFPVINFECTNFHADTFTVLPVNNIDSIMKDFEQMKKLFLLKNNRTMVMSIFYKILSNIANTESEEAGMILPALKYIENHYTESVTNLELAQMCNISEIYFRKLFTRIYKVSPRQYIINLRINKSEQLLTEGVFKISAVAERCGFSNPYHFCRLFKSKTGLTPSEYMKKNKIYNK